MPVASIVKLYLFIVCSVFGFRECSVLHTCPALLSYGVVGHLFLLPMPPHLESMVLAVPPIPESHWDRLGLSRTPHPIPWMAGTMFLWWDGGGHILDRPVLSQWDSGMG